MDAVDVRETSCVRGLERVRTTVTTDARPTKCTSEAESDWTTERLEAKLLITVIVEERTELTDAVVPRVRRNDSPLAIVCWMLRDEASMTKVASPLER